MVREDKSDIPTFPRGTATAPSNERNEVSAMRPSMWQNEEGRGARYGVQGGHDHGLDLFTVL